MYKKSALLNIEEYFKSLIRIIYFSSFENKGVISGNNIDIIKPINLILLICYQR